LNTREIYASPLLATETATMKKNATSLTVDGEIVVKARELIEKARLPFSVSKLVSTLVFEAFNAIENNTAAELPTAAQLRRAIHGHDKNTASQHTTSLLATIENVVAKMLAERGIDDDYSARVAEPAAKYKAKRKA
jgi:hypothetical protein